MAARGDRGKRTVRLRAVSNPVQEDVLRLLKDLLLDAKQGRIIGIAVGVAEVGRCDGNCFALGASDIATLNLALDRCKRRLLDFGHATHEVE